MKFARHKAQCPQTYIKLPRFEDNDGRKLPLEYYLLSDVFRRIV